MKYSYWVIMKIYTYLYQLREWSMLVACIIERSKVKNSKIYIQFIQ